MYPNTNKLFSLNNFDLIRLFAATQVVLHHTVEFLGIHQYSLINAVLWITKYFPGVPLFFFTSGYLISKSFENNPNLVQYASNRALRLYPALVVSTLFTLSLIFLSDYLASIEVSIAQMVLLILSKITFVQFYNPDFLRAYGDGVFNGNLWTITVELQFYVLTPILYLVFPAIRNQTRKAASLLLVLIAIFLFTNQFYITLPRENIVTKLINVSFIPWFYMFLAGIAFQKYFDFFHRLLAGKFHIVCSVYILICWGAEQFFAFNLGNTVNPLVFIGLALTVFSAAYSAPNLSNKVLRRNDVSYGVYIYHMPILNFLLYTNNFSKEVQAWLSVTLTFVIAYLSWRLIEKPCLKLKKKPLIDLNKSAN